MESQAPSVAALVVASQPDGGLGDTLRSLLAQDYEALEIIVVAPPAAGEAVSELLGPESSVRLILLEEDRGFGAAINTAAPQVGEAAFLLLCHDDVMLASDAVHLMVEESFRSNAAVVAPKIVSTMDHRVLLHVGQSIDHHATIVERILPGEVDQGQHDAVRDIFVAPGAATLIRSDLFVTLGGFDERYLAMGDDLELSWRARLAGARLVCASQAVVAHSERVASGSRMVEVASAQGISLSRLRRRNDLRTLLVCLRPFRRVVTLSYMAILNLAEIIVAGIGGDHDRAVDLREAWRSAWRERKANRRARKAVEVYRTVSDRTVRSFQTPGVTRLRTFLRTFFHHGYDAARGVIPHATSLEYPDDFQIPDTVGFGGAFSDDEGFDDLDDLGHRGRHRGRSLSSNRTLFFICGAGVLLFLAGSRNLIGARLPLIGQLVPLGSFASVWHHVFASWQPGGLGSSAPGHPAQMTLGLLGIVTLGQMGFVVRLLLLAAVPLGAIGIFRLLAPVASTRAKVLGAFVYGGLALGINAIALGSLSGLVAVALMPFIIRRVLRLLRVPPFDEAFPPDVAFATRGWRRSASGQVSSLALLLALGGSLAPALLVDVVLLSLSVAFVAFVRPGARPLAGQGRIIKALLLTLVLLAPLVVNAVVGGLSGFGVFGTALGPWSSPGIGGLLRFAVGPSGVSPFAWLVPIAALVPLLVARAERLVFAAQLSGIALASLGLGLFVSRGGAGAFAPDLLVVLAPLAVALSAMVALGLSALETDLTTTHFGWRQLVAGLGVAFALISLLPTVGSVSNGRWKLPSQGYADTLSYLNGSREASYRILWLGDPRTIPGASFQIEKGLSWATSAGGLPTGETLFVPPTPTATAGITTAVRTALTGDTVRLGQLLAPMGINTIVVTTSVAPTLVGVQTGVPAEPPATLIPALAQQADLREVPGGTGAAVFESALAIARVATRDSVLPEGASSSDPAAIKGWIPLARNGGGLSGTAPKGTRQVIASLAPASSFSVEPPVSTATAFGFAKTSPASAGLISVRLTVLPLNALIALVMLGAWLGLMLALLGRHRWLDWWWPRTRRARHVAADGIEAEHVENEVGP